MNMNVTISTNNYDIISNGSILISSDQTIKFEITNLIFIFTFIDDFSNLTTRVDADVDASKKIMNLKFINFNNSLGTYNIEPINLGHIGEKQLFLNYRICRAKNLQDSKQILVHYTWFLSRGDNNDKK